MFRSVRHVRIRAFVIIATVAITLGVEFLLLRPVSGMGARFDTPQRAISEAFGPTGWLGAVDQLVLPDQAVTAEAQCLFTVGAPGTLSHPRHDLPSLGLLMPNQVGVAGSRMA